MKNTPQIISMEQCIEQGVSSEEIRNASAWHKERARLSPTEDKERHYLLSAKLAALAGRLEGRGK